VPDIYEVLEAANLDLVGFVAPANYDPDYLITDAKLKARLTRLGRPERETFAELLTGNIKKHMFYCTASGTDTPSRIAQVGASMIPLLHDADMETIMPMLKAGKPLSGRREGLKVELPVPPLAVDILNLCDGKRTFEQIRQALKPSPGKDDFLDQARMLYRAFHGLNLMLLRAGTA